MLRRHLFPFAVITAVAIPFAACSSDDGGGSSSGGTGGTGASGGTGGTTSEAGVDPVEPGTQPPAKPDAPAAAGAEDSVVAIYELFVGDTDRAGTTDPTAWKDFGFNLDGIVSTKGGTNHCKPVEGASPASVKTDGTGGIDNSFGANLIPIIQALAADPSKAITESIQEGSFTIMVKMAKLEDPATKPSQTAIAAALYGGADMGSVPLWNGTDQWPVLTELLNGGNIDDPKVKFADSYINEGTWVSGSAGTIDLTIAIQGFELALQIVKAQVAMDVTGAGATVAATNGTIAGVLDTEQLIQELKKVAGGFDPSLCASNTFDSIAMQIRQASDIMADGTNGDDTKTCNAISIGLGFTGKAVQLGAVAPPAEPPADPCAADGGA